MRLLKEPLVHFLLIAAVVVAAERYYAYRQDRFRILMTADRVGQLVASYKLQFGIDAGPELREALVLKDFEDEVLYRQALALGLDQDDEMIRRRLIQKMQFVTEDRSAPAEPIQAELDTFFAAHRDRYRKSPSATFTHVFFSTDTVDETAARSRAEAVLNRLNRTKVLRAPTEGDVFPDNYDFASYEPQQVARLFGQTEFSAAVFTAPVGQWAGPYRSAYGWHLMRVEARKSATDVTIEDVRDRVRGDYLQQRQEAANTTTLATMKQQYRLIREDRGAGQ